MYQLRKILFIITILFSLQAVAQTNLTYDEVNNKSYALYEKGLWKELLSYGKEAVQANQDFILLRLRMGYAAFMLNNFSEAINQYNAQLGIYPLGNLKLYSFSVATVSSRPNSSAFNFRQIVGGQILKSLWIEGNVTLGSFKDLLENDAMYIYNAIDKNLIKGGVTAYVTISPKCTLDIGYTLEQRELAKSTNTFNQHSITGGLSWKL